MGGTAWQGPDSALPVAPDAGALVVHGAHLLYGGHRHADAYRGSPL